MSFRIFRFGESDVMPTELRRYPWSKLEPGDGFEVIGRTSSQMSGAISARKRKTGQTFTSRNIEGGVRVWRLT